MNFESKVAPGKPDNLAPNNAAARDEIDAPILSLDLRRILFIMRRNLLLILGVLALAGVLGLVVTMLMTPRYTAVAKLQIDQETDRILSESSSVRPEVSIQDAERFLQTQVDVLSSRTMALRVARSLNLLGNLEFFAAMKVPVPEVNGTVAPAKAMRETTLDLLADNMEITLPRQSRVISISFNSPDPELAQRVANSFAREYIAANLQRKFDSSDYAREFLATELAQAKSRLEASERAVNDYARRAQLIRTGGGRADERAGGSGSGSGGGSVTTASLVHLNDAAMTARADRIAAEGRWRATSRGRTFDIPEVLANPAMQDLLQQRAVAEAKLREQRARHRDDHPTVQQRVAEVAELNQQAEALAGQIRSSLEAQYTAALNREKALLEQVDAFKSETLAEQDRSVQYSILAREADTNRALYEGLLQRFKEVSTAAGISTNNVSIVDEADAPIIPSSPKLIVNLALALLLGGAAAVGIVLAREHLDDRIRAPTDIPDKLGLPVIGTIPLLQKKQDIVEEVTSPRSMLAEAHATLRTTLEISSVNGVPKTLAITSNNAGEGKSTTSFALAVSFARLGRRVLLVGGDLRRPSLQKFFTLPNSSGLTNLLTSHDDPAEHIHDTDYPNLHVLLSGPHPPVPADLLGSDRMGDVIHELSERFDLVIIDAPPVLGLADAALICSRVEATLFVVEANRGSPRSTQTAVTRLAASGARLVGAVLTKFDTRKASSEYSYYGYNYYSYGSGDEAKEVRAIG